MRLLEISTSAMEFLSDALGQMGVGTGSESVARRDRGRPGHPETASDQLFFGRADRI